MKHKQLLQILAVLGLLAATLGIFLPPVVMSIGMMTIVGVAILSPDKLTAWRQFTQTKALVLISLFFIAYLLSGLYSSNVDWYVNRLQLYLPFLVMPIAILAIPNFDRKTYYGILLIFLLTVTGICLYLTGYYFTHVEMMNELYKKGQVLPTPIMHIHFSLMVVYCAFIAFQFYIKRWTFKWHWESYVYLGIALFLVLFVHLLAVRSGMVTLYFTIVALLMVQGFRKGSLLKNLAIVVALMLAAVVAVIKVPTLQNKYRYTKYNLEEFYKGNDIARLSDSYRIVSITAGVNIAMQSPVIGVGVGDVKDETAVYVAEHFPDLAHITYTPQNQFVVVFAALGLLGVLLFICMIFAPAWMSGFWDELQYLAFHIILLCSFLFEQILETQVGIAFYLVFSLMGMAYLLHRKTSKD